MTEEFISILEDFLGVKRTPFSMAEKWAESPPKEANGKPLMKYLEKVPLFQQWSSVITDHTECLLGVVL